MKQLNQIGRSMTEIVVVLAIIAVLSIAAVTGLKLAMNKHQANIIIKDAFLAYFEAVDNQNGNFDDWTQINIMAESNRDFYAYKDEDNEAYIKTLAVEQGVCTALLNLASEDKLSFYTEENKPMTNCTQNNNIIFAFNGLKAMGLNCQSTADCPDEESYCDLRENVCAFCQDGYTINPTRTGCDINCSEEETRCYLGTDTWCCPNTQLCGPEMGQCVPSDGTCEWFISEQTTKRSYTCAYEIKKQATQKEYTCSYNILEQTTTKEYTCAYKIKIGSTDTNGTLVASDLEKVKDECPVGQYCHLNYIDTTCETTAGADYTDTIYGSCHDLEQTNQGCPVKTVSETITVAKDECPQGQYCHLNYIDTTCETPAGADFLGTMYGSCHDLEQSNQGCPVKTVSETVTVVEDNCPQGQYCHLNYIDTSCATTAGADFLGTMYGSCHDLEQSNQGCPISYASTPLKSVKDCPQASYCYLNWSEEDCSKTAPADITKSIFGDCIDYDSNQPVCPWSASNV